MRLLLGALAAAVAALEPLDPATGVHQLLLAGIARMAFVAELDVEFVLGRAGGEGVPAGAPHLGLGVLRMDFGLHGVLSNTRSARNIAAATHSAWASWRFRRGTRRCSWWT